MNRRRTLVVAGLSIVGLVIVGGCANPRGTANALSAVVSVSSPAPASPAPSSPVLTSRAAGSTHVLDSPQIYGAVTAASERELVLTYLGGDCDMSAHGEVAESASTITVHVSIAASNGVCSAVGYVRTVVVQLSAPWGNRLVQDLSGATVPVVDGALLLSPSWLPDGYQGGGITAGGSEDGGATSDQEWGPPSVTATSAAGALTCPPTPGISLVQGYGITAVEPLVPGSYSLADGIPLTVTRDQFNDLDLYWTPPGHPTGWTVAVESTPECGTPVVPLDTLLKVANGLH